MSRSPGVARVDITPVGRAGRVLGRARALVQGSMSQPIAQGRSRSVRRWSAHGDLIRPRASRAAPVPGERGRHSPHPRERDLGAREPQPQRAEPRGARRSAGCPTSRRSAATATCSATSSPEPSMRRCAGWSRQRSAPRPSRPRVFAATACSTNDPSTTPSRSSASTTRPAGRWPPSSVLRRTRSRWAARPSCGMPSTSRRFGTSSSPHTRAWSASSSRVAQAISPRSTGGSATTRRAPTATSAATGWAGRSARPRWAPAVERPGTSVSPPTGAPRPSRAPARVRGEGDRS